MVGDLVNKDIGHVGDDDALLGGTVHVLEPIHPDAAHSDDLAAGKRLDEGPRDAMLADDRVGIAGLGEHRRIVVAGNGD